MSARYYAIRVGSETRIEKAESIREACKLAFGSIYDSWEDEARAKDLGTRRPLNVAKALDNPNPEWRRIPPPKGVRDVTFDVQKCEVPGGYNNLNHFLGSLPCVVRALQSDDGKQVKVRLDTMKKDHPFFGMYVQDQSKGSVIITAPSVLDTMPMPSAAKSAEQVRKALVGFALEPRDRITILDMVKLTLERDESDLYLTDCLFDPANDEALQTRINKVAVTVLKQLRTGG